MFSKRESDCDISFVISKKILQQKLLVSTATYIIRFWFQVESLQKKILRSNEVVSVLVQTIFTPRLIFEFNVNGYNKHSFKKTKINDIFLGM